MKTNSRLLNKLLANLNSHPVNQNHFLSCLYEMAKQLGLELNCSALDNLDQVTVDNIHLYERNMNILIYPISATSINDLSSYLHPILIQSNHNYFVLVKGKAGNRMLYDPTKNTYFPINLFLPEVIINKAWQCFPNNFPMHSHLRGLLQSICKYFNKELFNIILLGLLSSTSLLIISIVMGYILGNITEINQNGYFVLFISFFTFILSSTAISFVNDLHIKSLTFKVIFYTLPSVWNHVLAIPIETSKKLVSGELVQKIMDYETAICSIITAGLSMLFNGIALLFLFFYLAYCNTLLALAYFLICALFFLIKISILPRNIQHISSQYKAQGRLTSLLNEALLQIHKIRSSGTENQVYTKWLYGLIDKKIYEEKSLKLEMIIYLLEVFLPFSLSLLIYSSVPFWPKEPNILILLPFMLCAGQFGFIFEKLSAEFAILIHQLPGLNRLDNLLQKNKERYPDGNADFKLNGKFTFTNIYLSHPDADKFILEDVSLHIEPGKFIAFIGPSGAGKTSIFKLLLGFITAHRGSIMIDGQNIKNLNMHDIRKQFGVVLQTTNILPGTVYSNIALNANITLSEAWELAKLVGLEREIKDMPMKMYTHISDNAGESISGGQRQKILIARALASRPKVLLLDEATSALDNKSQAIIHQNLKKMNITRIVIAHRYTTIMDADEIYVVDQGKIVSTSLRNCLDTPNFLARFT